MVGTNHDHNNYNFIDVEDEQEQDSSGANNGTRTPLLLHRRLSSGMMSGVSLSSKRVRISGIPDEEDQIDARRVLQSKPSGVIHEGDTDADQQMVRLANIRNVIFPWGWYWVWWTTTLIGAVATAFFLPYEIAFQEEQRTIVDLSTVVEMTLNAIFTIDIVVCFNLAFYSKDDRLVFDRTVIARTYLTKMFVIDLCGVFPFESFFLLITGNIMKSTSDVLLFSLWKLARLVRLHRLKRMSEILQYDGHISFLWFTLLRNFTAVLLVAHWEACTMYFIARYRDFDEETWLGPLVSELGTDYTAFDYYLTSLYLSVVTFCTVGYGDFSPVNSIEKLIGSFFMLLNIVIAAWIIGSITLLIVKGDEKTGEYRDSLETLKQYGEMHNFDDPFMRKLKSNLKLGFQNREISDEQVLKPFPSAVRRKILRKLYLKPLVQTQLMRGVRQQFVDAFLASCTVEIFSPGDEIVERGSILSDLFLLVGGIAEISTHGFGGRRSVVDGDYVDSEDETRPRSTKLGPGDFIGEIAFFTESPQVDSVVTVTTCKTLTISQSTYKILVQDHPGSAGKILQNLLEKVESLHLRLPLPEEIPALRVGSVFNNAAGTIPSDLETMDSTYDYGAFDSISNTDEEYFSRKEALTAVTDLVKMHMSKQLDDQTTRLLFAASRGDTTTISLMCDQGFDPNNSDYDNRTALMVASMKGNTDVVRLLLVDYKASPNLADMHGSTALLEAVKNGHEDTMDVLKLHGGELCMDEHLAASVICQAVFDGDSTLLRRLLEAGIPVNAADYDKRTASHIAAAEGNLSAIRVLAGHGADLKAVDRWGNTPLMEARQNSSRQVLEFLAKSK